MASYLGIPEEAVPPPLRRFVSQAPFARFHAVQVFWGGVNDSRHFSIRVIFHIRDLKIDVNAHFSTRSAIAPGGME